MIPNNYIPVNWRDVPCSNRRAYLKHCGLNTLI